MNNRSTQETAKIHSRLRPWFFPVGVAIAYLILFVISQGRTLIALQASGRVFLQASPPLLLAFGLMFLLNLFISPAHVSNYLGHGTGVKGILLSSIAGIISMGPIFAWYPLLKILKEKGASDFHLANFLANRAVKPVLLPLMITYFGWRFSIVFTVICIVCALLTAATVHGLGRSR
jgi:uncharacterized membrane protein YraQ (UPF0718 family)